MMATTITKIIGREILDSRGNPTLEAEVFLSQGMSVCAAVPSGASTGQHEAVELRDGDSKRYGGKGVLKAVSHVNDQLAPLLIGKDPRHQQELDQLMLSADGQANKSHLGANAILAVSLALAKAGALVENQALHDYIAQGKVQSLPAPMMNIINGGAHSNNGLNFQEFMIMPLGFDRFDEALRAGTEVFHALKKHLHDQNLSTSVGDEGGFAPHIKSHREALDMLMKAIIKAGYKPGEEIYLALDVASSEFYRDQAYHLTAEGLALDASQMVDYLACLVADYPIISIEDGMAEEDWQGWALLTQKLERIQLVGDDIFVTNTQLLSRAIQEKVANAILIKPNQIGSLTETIAAVEMAKAAQFGTVMSHRSGETEDTTIADLAVGLNTQQIKTGSLCRTDRVAKYNQLLRIASRNPNLCYAGAEIKRKLAS